MPQSDQDDQDHQPNYSTDWKTSWFAYCDHIAEEEEEAARETEEVEDEVFVYETSQAALRELEREVDHLHVITYSNALLTMLCRAPLLPLTSTLPSPLTLPLSLALSLLLALPLLLVLFLRMSRPQLSLKAYVVP